MRSEIIKRIIHLPSIFNEQRGRNDVSSARTNIPSAARSAAKCHVTLRCVSQGNRSTEGIGQSYSREYPIAIGRFARYSHLIGSALSVCHEPKMAAGRIARRSRSVARRRTTDTLFWRYRRASRNGGESVVYETPRAIDVRSSVRAHGVCRTSFVRSSSVALVSE